MILGGPGWRSGTRPALFDMATHNGIDPFASASLGALVTARLLPDLDKGFAHGVFRLGFVTQYFFALRLHKGRFDLMQPFQVQGVALDAGGKTSFVIEGLIGHCFSGCNAIACLLYKVVHRHLRRHIVLEATE